MKEARWNWVYPLLPACKYKQRRKESRNIRNMKGTSKSLWANITSTTCQIEMRNQRSWFIPTNKEQSHHNYFWAVNHKVHICAPRVTQCLSPRPNWDPHPLSCKRVGPPPPETKGGQHLPAGEEAGGPNSDDWRKGLALCLLCAMNYSCALSYCKLFTAINIHLSISYFYFL
jgi:hypothetical protein